MQGESSGQTRLSIAEPKSWDACIPIVTTAQGECCGQTRLPIAEPMREATKSPQDFVDQVRPRRQVQREHVQDAGWRRGNGSEAHELPLPHSDFQHGSPQLARPPHASC